MVTTIGRHLPRVVVVIGCVFVPVGVPPTTLAGARARASPRDRGDVPQGVVGSSSIVLRTVRVGLRPGAIAVDERTRRAFVVDAGLVKTNGHPGGRGSVSVLDAGTGAVVRTTAVGADAGGPGGQVPVVVVADARVGRVLVPTSDGMRGALIVLDSRTGAVRQTLTGYGPGIQVAVDDRDGKAFVGDTIERAGQGSPARISIIDPMSGATRRTFTLPAASDAASVFPDKIGGLAVDARAGRLVVVHAAIGGRAEDVEAGPPSAVNILDAATGAVRATTTVGGLADVIAIDQGAGRAVVAAPCDAAAGAPACQARVSVLDIGRGAVRGVSRLPTSSATTDRTYRAYPRAVVVSVAADEHQGRAFVSFQTVATRRALKSRGIKLPPVVRQPEPMRDGIRDTTCGRWLPSCR